MPDNPDSPIQFDDVIAEELAEIRRLPRTSGAEPPPLSALCISAGGIRSATFALGAIQGLSEEGVLEEFDYLSTVSGGGYIGAWLTSWKHRAGGLSNILEKLYPAAPPMPPGALDPIGHLREYNNYLSPRLGFLSADTWTLAATVILNMALNWLVFVPLLMFALTVPRLILALGLLSWYHPGIAPPELALPLRIVSGLAFAVGIFNTLRYLPSVGGKDHTETDFLKYCLSPMIFAALAFMTYDSWYDPSTPGPSTPSYLQTLLWMAGSFGSGWAGYVVFCGKKRFRLLFGPLSLAILLTSAATALAAWLLVTQTFLRTTWPRYITTGPPLLLLSFLAAGALFVGLTSRALQDDDREWLARSAAWMLLFVVCWTGVCGLVLIAPAWFFSLGAWAESAIAAAGGLAGWLCALAGFASKTIPSQEENHTPQGPKAFLRELSAKLAAPVFIGVLLVGLAILTNRLLGFYLSHLDWTRHEDFLEFTPIEIVAAGAVSFLLVGWAAAKFININKFSLHGMYRNRLIRAYLGASNQESKTNRFLGFSKTDNIYMAKLSPELRPFHVVNITLNLVSGNHIAWQQRKAESFTVTALHSGSASLGYRPSKDYGGPDGISLGTAITISGAAASPSMGYHSSGAIGFIMTLFNARLGAWLGNPSDIGRQTWREDGPSSAVGSLIKEAFGLTDDTSAYVYLSDGGHFENLGLYEMVRRRCKQIVVLDSGCDPRFIYEDLGNALRKIRIDMGITIDFEDAFHKKRCAFAKIRYSHNRSEDGELLYIKPMVTGNEPPDVATYRASHPDFPHQGTGDQWYDESQTESYRMLGLHTLQEIGAGWNGEGGLSGMFDHVRKSYSGAGKAVGVAAA